MITISTLKFDEKTPENLKLVRYGSNWPAVYIVNNGNEAYIGESVDVSNRAKHHLKNNNKKKLEQINIISDDTFNKSTILDLESFLIKYMAADNKFVLQNGNWGLKNHNYYQKDMYEKQFESIWKKLRKKGIVQNDLKLIENSTLFKYSPYKSLTYEQYMIVNDVLNTLVEEISTKEKAIFMVHGGAGTGKTILAIYLLMLIKQIENINKLDEVEDEIDKNLLEILRLSEITDKLNIGLVVPTTDLRKSIKEVFRNTQGLMAKMVLSPSDVVKSDNKYDILIVDESHRLRRDKCVQGHDVIRKNNYKLNLCSNGTELDWILKKSKYQIFFYDRNQTIKPADVRKEDFEKLMLSDNYHEYHLETQMRCLLGGNEYVKYIRDIFSENAPVEKMNFKKYDLKLFDNVNEMIEEIKNKDKKFDLCRNVAGYAWPWKTKGCKIPKRLTKKELNKMIKKGMYDIEIQGYKYIWNSSNNVWVSSPNSINEIGCIHTIQGFDLNYVGVIIGNELKYDKENQKFIVDRSNYYDKYGKNDTDDQELLEYILNIYYTLCTRGMRGTYIYVCDNNLRDYLKKYIN